MLVWAFWKNGHTIKEVGKSSVQGGLAAGDPEKGLVVKFKTEGYISTGRIPSVWRRSFSSSIQALSGLDRTHPHYGEHPAFLEKY